MLFFRNEFWNFDSYFNIKIFKLIDINFYGIYMGIKKNYLIIEFDLLYLLKISETHLEQLWKPLKGLTWFLSVISISSYKDELSLFWCSLHPGLWVVFTVAITSRIDFSSGENTGLSFCGSGRSWFPEKLRTFRAGRLNTKFGISVNRLLSSKITSTLGCRHNEVGMKIRRLFLINKSLLLHF